ncbi:transcription antitermination factor NusB [Marinobacterium sp. LSUCC0821]|jgi:N utilization substance protein B|uniref:transcription antitermination factor NusB n=1 Tax=Marinobacterium sp. LSUCC0821 TaxID=2668067 RepID=UPI0014513BC4|nr:transcription antitermination factor NusB [Marinobacterium sp. LSUCC0821]QJD72018.1 transcription antitermination factor NusB [Marinobacterium sp. LSUCC0821]
MSEEQAPKRKKVSNTEKRRNARSFTLQALYSQELTQNPTNEVEAHFRVDNDMSETDVPLFSELLQGINTQKADLDKAFEIYLDRRVDELDPIELSILRIGSFELINRIEVPYKVAINESVELAKIFGATDSHRYVNGVLDKLAQKVRMVEIKANRGK